MSGYRRIRRARAAVPQRSAPMQTPLKGEQPPNKVKGAFRITCALVQASMIARSRPITAAWARLRAPSLRQIERICILMMVSL